MSVVWHGPKATAAAKRGAARGLLLGAEHVLEEANRIVPHEEGTLQGSGIASVDEGALRGAISYDTVYAVRQHEELTWVHDDGRQAKYLETPLYGGPGRKAMEIVAREVKSELGA
jgi:hypothetical protein